jgi:nucleoside-diphosphate-sugar epimerase
VSTLIIGCGFLGQGLGRLLCQRRDRVFGTVRSPARAAAIADLGIEPVIADVLSPGSLRALPSVDRMFYCVGFDRAPVATMKAVYVDGLKNVLESLPNSVTRLVYASSTGVYGQTDGEWVDEASRTDPRHESGKVCLEAETCARAWAQTRQASAVVLRYAGLYGLGRVVRRSLVEQGAPIPGDPHKFLNLIHIDDAARAAATALAADRPESIYLIGDDRPVTREEYYSRVATLLQAPKPRFEPSKPGSTGASRDETNKRVCNRRMKASLDVTLIYPDIATGLAAALDRASSR